MTTVREALLKATNSRRPCEACKGKKGFYDTTYIRTGAWIECIHCLGTGIHLPEGFVKRAVVKALGPTTEREEQRKKLLADVEKWQKELPGVWYAQPLLRRIIKYLGDE